jgi:hypothetical protein
VPGQPEGGVRIVGGRRSIGSDNSGLPSARFLGLRTALRRIELIVIRFEVTDRICAGG